MKNVNWDFPPPIIPIIQSPSLGLSLWSYCVTHGPAPLSKKQNEVGRKGHGKHGPEIVRPEIRGAGSGRRRLLRPICVTNMMNKVVTPVLPKSSKKVIILRASFLNGGDGDFSSAKDPKIFDVEADGGIIERVGRCGRMASSGIVFTGELGSSRVLQNWLVFYCCNLKGEDGETYRYRFRQSPSSLATICPRHHSLPGSHVSKS